MKNIQTIRQGADIDRKINMTYDINIHLEDRKLSRYFFVFIWMMYAVVYMTKNCFNAALTSIVAEGILTKSQTGFITSAFYLAYAPMQIVGGIAADKYSPAKLIKIGLIGGAISNLLVYWNQNYYVILAVWIFNAIIQFGLWPGVFKIVSSQLVRSDRTNMIFYITFASSCGLLLSYITGAFLTNWKWNFLVSAIALFVFCMGLDVYCRYLSPYMKRDKTEEDAVKTSEKNTDNAKKTLTTASVLAVSGFGVVTVVVFLRTMLDQGVKALTPVMLMECYDNVSPRDGNLLNLMVIISGIVGTILVKMFLYPKRVENEMNAMAGLMVLAIPFTAILLLVGKWNLLIMIVVLCIWSILVTGAGLFVTLYSKQFVKFGKNGTVAGIINASAAIGIVVAGYGFLRVSELWDWKAVTALWTGLTIVVVVLLFTILPTYKKFKEM